MEVYVLASWAMDGGYRLASTASAGKSDGPVRAIDVMAPLSAVLGAALLALYLYRRYRIKQRLDFDTLLFAALLLASWQSPLMNWFHPVLVANTHVLGAVGSWGPYMPGWQGFGSHQEAELPLVTLSISVSALLAVLACSKIMTLIMDRWPGTSRVRLVLSGFLLAVLVDAAEPLLTFLGVVAWSRAVPEVTLWSGNWYQFPLYQMLATGLFTGALSALRCLRNVQGESWLERGAVRLPPAIRPWARLLAVVGGTNAALTLYTGLHILVSLVDGAPPAHLPDYFRPPTAY
ncbi:spirocyclase AveC family protein [Streptomyces sp. NPDC046215]|uniref:spirocyclase AveC family protein n=1 Tax=Streptomyces TaxID=1883 RepID=UPI0031D73DE7